MKWLGERLTEPSSHAGIANVIATSFAMLNGMMPLAVGVPSMLAAILAILIPEKET
jgi:hypothetical protein